MSAQMKSAAILSATLLIGFVAGAAVTGALFRERLDYVRTFVSQEGFVDQVGELIEPLTEEQEREITPILETAGGEIEQLVLDARQEVAGTLAQMNQDVAVHLTEEQRKELSERQARARNRYIGRYTIFKEDELYDENTD